MSKKWYESDNPERYVAGANRLAAKSALFWVLVTLGLCALVAVVWALFTWGTSDVGGQMDAQKDKNSGENRVKQQEAFHTNLQSVLTYDRNIQAAYDAKTEDPTQVNKINYTGLVQNCNDAQGAYNALAQKFRAEEFRDADLPERLPDTDPGTPTTEEQTDCKENQK